MPCSLARVAKPFGYRCGIRKRRQALAWPEGVMARVTVYHDNIKQMIAEIQESFDRNGPIRMDVEASVPDGFSPASATTTAFYLPRLLLWLDQQGREQPGVYVDPAAFANDEALEPDFVGNLITLLEQKRYIAVARSLENRAMPDSLVTDRGKAEAQGLRERRAEPVARLRYARETLMKWMFANFGGSRADVAAFAQARESSFLGSQLTGEEIIAAVRYLADKKLIAADSPGGGFRLASDGIDCVTSGVPMNEYLAHQPMGGPVYNVTNPRGSIIGGEHQTVNQTNTFGFNPSEVSQLATWAALIKQISPTLGLPEADQRELDESAQALVLEVAAPVHEPSRLRHVADRVTTALANATQITAALTMLIEAGRRAYSAVFGG
jgi:hypothetical protein